MMNKKNDPKIIVALDFDKKSDALTFVDKVDPNDCYLKVGKEMFTYFGPDFVRELVAKDFKVFLDLKFHDIPNTVAKAVKAAADLGVWMINVHASGGSKMMIKAKEALIPYGDKAPLLIAVTVLTSMKYDDLREVGIHCDPEEQVERLANLANHAGLDGVVSSALEVDIIKATCGNSFLTITPGIRPAGSNTDDQERIMTPKDAIDAGSDYLVIGRPITQAKDPKKVLKEINASIS